MDTFFVTADQMPDLHQMLIFQDGNIDPFDLTVTGPWIGRWEIVNSNKHTEAFRKVTQST